jgi:hypothetical protein
MAMSRELEDKHLCGAADKRHVRTVVPTARKRREGDQQNFVRVMPRDVVAGISQVIETGLEIIHCPLQ